MKHLSGVLFTVIMVSISYLSANSFAGTAFEDTLLASSSMGLSLEKLLNLKVTTATLTEVDLDKVPSAMSVITETEIRRSGARDLYELLDNVRGIAVRATNHIGNIKGINIRGTTSNFNKVKILINGHNILHPNYDDFQIDLPLENVKQVEIIRGPGSCLYGANAFAGVVNIITKTAAEIDGAQIDVKYGSFNTQNVDVTYGKKFDGVELVLNANYVDADDYGAVIEEDAAYGKPVSLAPKEVDAGKRTKTNGSIGIVYNQLKANAAYFDSKAYHALNILGYLTQDGGYSHFKYGYVDAEYDIPASDQLRIKVKGTYDHRYFSMSEQLLPDDFRFGRDVLGIDIDIDMNNDGIIETFPDGAFLDQAYKTVSYGTELVVNYTVSDTNLLTAGLFYEKTQCSDHYYETNLDPLASARLEPPPRFEGDQSLLFEADRVIYGLFLQDQWDITDDWYLVAGVRHDYYDDIGGTLNPRYSLVHTFDHDSAGIIKLIYGTAFKAPTFAQMYITNADVFAGRELEPEKITSYEVNLGYLFFDRIKTGFTIYQLHTEDLIDFETGRAATYNYINYGKRKAWGIESTLRYIIKENTDVYFSYDYTDSKDDILDEEYSFMPDTQITCGLNIHAWRYFHWNVNFDYVSSMKRQEGDARGKIDPLALINTTFSLENYKGWDVYVSIHNVTDEEHFIPSLLPGTPYGHQVNDIPLPERDITVGARVHF